MEYERVREKIAKQACLLKTGRKLSRHGLEMIQFWDFADQILSLVEIRADNQSLPKGLTVRLNLPDTEHYIYGEEALSRAGFIRVIPKPKEK